MSGKEKDEHDTLYCSSSMQGLRRLHGGITFG